MSASRLAASRLATLLLAAPLLAAGGAAETCRAQNAAWPGSFLARVEALALLQSLNAELLSHDSATLTLEHWCAVHRLASPAQIIALRVAGADKPPSPEQRIELAVAPDEPVRYRHVRLQCGGVLLSEADNWYIPARLTRAMNAALDSTDVPFGKVVAPLHFRRRTLAARLLWQPLPEGWEMRGTEEDCGSVSAPTQPPALTLPPALIEHRALLTLPDGTPLSEVVETYSSNVLGFAIAQPAPACR
jgi:hypothetical protein